MKVEETESNARSHERAHGTDSIAERREEIAAHRQLFEQRLREKKQHAASGQHDPPVSPLQSRDKREIVCEQETAGRNQDAERSEREPQRDQPRS